MLSGPGHHDLQRRAIGEPHRRERREAARAARQQHLAVAHQQPRFQPDAALERRHHGEIEFVGQHHVGQHAAVALEHVQAHVGMARHEVVERRRQHRAGEGRHQPDAQVAGDEAGEAARLLVGVFEPADRLDAALVVAQPRRRRHDAARRALEQLHAERALDRGDVLRDAGLGGVLALGRARERAFLADGDDGADLPKRDIGQRTPAIKKTNAKAQNILFRLAAPSG